MVPSNGHMRKEEWHTQVDNRLPTSQHPRHQGNTSRRKLSLTHGMVTTVYPFTETSPLQSSLLGITTDIAQPHKASDGYTRRYNKIVSSIQNKTKCVDDTLLWSNTIEESFFQAANWLDICGRYGITLNPDKFRFAQDVVEFSGFEMILSNHARNTSGPSPTSPAPQNLRSWFGWMN